MGFINRLFNWYFTKNSLPYWVIFLLDCGILMVSGMMVYWVFNRIGLIEDFWKVESVEHLDIIYLAESGGIPSVPYLYGNYALFVVC